MRSLILLPFLVLPVAAEGQDSPSAFRFARDKKVKSSVDLKEVRRGIPRADPRDAIPAIRKPKHLLAKKASWLRSDDRVLGMIQGDEARAYPVKILVAHEIANDVLGGVPIGATY
jgi:hypothetical protein